MIEDEIRKKGLIPAPRALDAAVLRHARQTVERSPFQLDIPWQRWAVGYVPFLVWWLIVAAMLRGARTRVSPALPLLTLKMPRLTIGDIK